MRRLLKNEGPELEPKLEPKLEAVLVRLCEKLGRLFKTQAVKLPYLVDVVANNVVGMPITEGRHETWEYGVVTSQVWCFISHAQDSGPFRIEKHDFSEGGQVIELKSPLENELSAQEQEIVDFVAERFGRLGAERLGMITKALNTEIGQDEWGTNREASITDDAFARLSEGWQAFAERLPNLDLDDRSNWIGPIEDDPREYFESLLDA